MRTTIIILLLGLCWMRLSSQTITNVVATQDGDNVVITYNLECEGSADIALYYSEDNGSSFKGPLKTVSGDVGEQVQSGTNKRISWSVLKDQEILFGNNIIFRVTGFYKFGKLIDNRDGRTYRTVKIGNQVWMAENLNYKARSGYYCYNKSPANCDIYGGLYDWETAINACPNGWHLPRYEEWTELIAFLGGEDKFDWNAREAGSAHWPEVYDFVKNVSGFTALPSGFHDSGGKYLYLGSCSVFWSSTVNNLTGEWGICLGVFECKYALKSYKGNPYGFSVRCIKN
jgi:uncharacterized protein (TIGR02145 family)